MGGGFLIWYVVEDQGWMFMVMGDVSVLRGVAGGWIVWHWDVQATIGV